MTGLLMTVMLIYIDISNRDDDIYYPAKVCDVSTVINRESTFVHVDGYGAYIDIFPLDNAPDFRKADRQNRVIKRYRRILFLKTGFSRIRNRKDKVYMLCSRFMSCKAIHERIRAWATKYNGADTAYLCNHGSYYATDREFFPREAFGTPVLTQFEDGMFPIPQKARDLLSTTYGDYMKEPPAEEQLPHHSFG